MARLRGNEHVLRSMKETGVVFQQKGDAVVVNVECASKHVALLPCTYLACLHNTLKMASIGLQVCGAFVRPLVFTSRWRSWTMPTHRVFMSVDWVTCSAYDSTYHKYLYKNELRTAPYVGWREIIQLLLNPRRYVVKCFTLRIAGGLPPMLSLPQAVWKEQRSREWVFGYRGGTPLSGGSTGLR